MYFPIFWIFWSPHDDDDDVWSSSGKDGGLMSSWIVSSHIRTKFAASSSRSHYDPNFSIGRMAEAASPNPPANQ